MNDMNMIDVSVQEVNKEVLPRKKDKFMTGIYVSLAVLVILGILIYFFGYNILKPFIKV